MMRNPNGFGSVYKLSGRRRRPYCARVTTGWTYDEERKKSYPIYKFIGYYANRKDAFTALVEYNKNPYDLDAVSVTFGELYEKWSDEHFEHTSESNIKGYKASYKLCGLIQDMPIKDIKLQHLQTIVDTSGKNSPTLKKLKILFSQVFDYALKHEVINKDKREIVRFVDISKAGNPNSVKRSPFTYNEIEMLWSVKDSNKYYSVILMLIYCGVRIGEMLDLKREDVHIDEKWFYVREAKTESGIREVPIADKVLPFFEYWYNQNNEYLVTTNDGEHFKYRNYVDSYWTPLLESLKLEKHRPHDTRHTCVSFLTEAGVDERIIKKIVGHKGQGITESVYTHIELPYKLEAINRI